MSDAAEEWAEMSNELEILEEKLVQNNHKSTRDKVIVLRKAFDAFTEEDFELLESL